MTFLIVTDYYDEYEVIEAPDKGAAEVYIIDMLNHNEPDKEVKRLGGSESLTLEDIRHNYKIDETLFLSDYEA